MADAPTTTATPPEPSMEEILASIRKIIADDGSTPAADNDVLELTQMVQDDGSVVDVNAPAPEVAPPPLAPEPVAPPPEPEPAPVLTAPEPPPPPPPPPPVVEKPIAKPSNGLTSESAAAAAMSSLNSLANTVEIDRLAHGVGSGTYLGNGGRTLEDLVIEMMRPILKEWLDQNLPATVDRLVQKEIERIARGSKE